jgi:UrcA family protein
MRRLMVTTAAGMLASSVLWSAAIAQAPPEVTVTTSRSVAATDPHNLGVPIVKVSLTYNVSTEGLDIASHAGAMQLEKRVSDAATAACKELGKQYPHSTPSDQDCAKAATANAMVKVHELEAAAAKSPGK